MTISNRLLLIPREMIHSVIEGADFGAPLYCIARSPTALLTWMSGHPWKLNGHQRYSESGMILFPQRRVVGNLIYRHIGLRGGRLSVGTLEAVRADIIGAFDPDAFAAMLSAMTHPRRTVLVDGGGPMPMPSRKLGDQAYRDWRALPDEERGFAVRGQKRVALGKVVQPSAAE